MLDLLHATRGRWDPAFVHRRDRTQLNAFGAWNPAHNESDSGTSDENGQSSTGATYEFEKVYAFWYTEPKASPAEGPKPYVPGQPIALHFHGGGYVYGTAAETDLACNLTKSLVTYTPVHHVLSVNYRLAPRAPWPLPLLDAIAAYHHLVREENVAERDIVITGDSADGHLALALTRWIRDEEEKIGLRMPRALALASPWCVPGFTNVWEDEASKHSAHCDTIDNTFGPSATSLLLRALPPSTMHESPYLAPSSLLISLLPKGTNSLAHFPPTSIVYGGAERLSREISVLWDRLWLARTG
ncbi:hypothetical protein Q5752_000155 [Cryptotrichosporon argae]